MPHDPGGSVTVWQQVKANRSYYPGALRESEGLAIKWHSPRSPRSSQVFCISAFGALNQVPDGNEILSALLRNSLPCLATTLTWRRPRFEHSAPELLGELGGGTPTCIDAFHESDDAVVCVESKFIADAKAGFGGCSQVLPISAIGRDGLPVEIPPRCAGFFGPGSDLDPITRHVHRGSCRLGVTHGSRAPRRYWEAGKHYFLPEALRAQVHGDACPFAGPNFQLMRNFLFAAEAAGKAADAPGKSRQFGVLAIAPAKHVQKIRTQVEAFRAHVLAPPYQDRIGVATYDQLVQQLHDSEHAESRRLGDFLEERINTLC